MNSIELESEGGNRPQPVAPAGRLERRRLAGLERQEYYLYRPAGALEGASVLVAVHGISRNAREQAEAFAEYADRCGVVVVAPLFPAELYPRYQQLGLARDSIFPRPDLALARILDEVGELTGARTERVYLFGHSGGGQFVHRYAMAYPQQVIAVAMGAPGWYTFPDRSLSYPLGIRKASTAGLIRMRANRFLRVPMAVSERLDERQGDNRLQRGRRWIKAMREAARARGYSTRYEFHRLERCNHKFQRCVERGDLPRKVFEFLFAGESNAMPGESQPHVVFHLP